MTTPTTRQKPLHIATFVLFVLVLVGPWIAGQLGASSETVERRALATFPTLDGESVREAATFGQINNYVRDRTPLRRQATGLVNGAWLQFGFSGDRRVMEGPDDYYFLVEDFTGPCDRGYELDDMVGQLSTYREEAAEGGKEFLFLVAPDKGAVLDYRLSARADVAANCGRVARPEFRNALDSTGVSFDLLPTLVAAERAAPDAGRWYYEHDSHWTFEAGGLVAGDIVEYFDDDLYDPQVIRRIDRSLPINGDVYRRMGIQRSLEVPDRVRVAERVDVFTDRIEDQIGGTRTVRSYFSGGDGEVIGGETIFVHDSMMNFVERQLAPYFEEAVFIHWQDLAKANFFERVRRADQVVFLRVERDVHSAVAGQLLDENFATRFAAALRQRPDPDLGADLQAAAGALRAFTRDTGGFVSAYEDLFVDPGVDGWLGPYLSGEPFEVSHPRYGNWVALREPEPASGARTDCAEFHSGDCAVWLLLEGVPPFVADEIDEEFDAADGYDAGRVRYDAASSTVYFYSLA